MRRALCVAKAFVLSDLSLYIDKPNKTIAHIQYKLTPLSSSFLFSLISMT